MFFSASDLMGCSAVGVQARLSPRAGTPRASGGGCDGSLSPVQKARKKMERNSGEALPKFIGVQDISSANISHNGLSSLLGQYSQSRTGPGKLVSTTEGAAVGDCPPGIPTRADAPIRRMYRRGQQSGLDTQVADQEAIRHLRSAKFAPSTVRSMGARVRWWAKRCQARGWSIAPIPAQRVELAGALLLKGGYRSGAAYLSTIKRLHVQVGA